jgi:hypothetical protein
MKERQSNKDVPTFERYKGYMPGAYLLLLVGTTVGLTVMLVALLHWHSYNRSCQMLLSCFANTSVINWHCCRCGPIKTRYYFNLIYYFKRVVSQFITRIFLVLKNILFNPYIYVTLVLSSPLCRQLLSSSLFVVHQLERGDLGSILIQNHLSWSFLFRFI